MKRGLIFLFFCTSTLARHEGLSESWGDYNTKLKRAVLNQFDALEYIDPNKRFGLEQESAPELLLRESMLMDDSEDRTMPLAKISWLLANGFQDIDGLFLKAAQLGQVEGGYALLPLWMMTVACLQKGISTNPTVVSDEIGNNALHYAASAGAYLHDFSWMISYLVRRTKYERVSANNVSGDNPLTIYRSCCRQQQRQLDRNLLLLFMGMEVSVRYPEILLG